MRDDDILEEDGTEGVEEDLDGVEETDPEADADGGDVDDDMDDDEL